MGRGIVMQEVAQGLDRGLDLDPGIGTRTGGAVDSIIGVIDPDLALDLAPVLEKGIDITVPDAMEIEAIVIAIDARADKNHSKSLCTYLRGRRTLRPYDSRDS